MDISYLNEFLVLASEKSFTSAAAKLFIAQPTLSRHISSLEESLGVRLFERGGRSAELTEAGRDALEDIAQIVQLYEGIRTRASRRETELVTIRVGILNVDRSLLVEPILSGFAQSSLNIEPQLSIVSIKEVIDGLLDDRFDVTFMPRLRIPHHETVRFHRILRMPLLAAVSADDSLAAEEAISVRRLTGRTFVNMASESDFYDQVYGTLVSYGVVPVSTEDTLNELTLPYSLRPDHNVSIVAEALGDVLPSTIRLLPLEEDIALDLCWAYKVSNPNAAIPVFIKASSHFIRSGKGRAYA